MVNLTIIPTLNSLNKNGGCAANYNNGNVETI